MIELYKIGDCMKVVSHNCPTCSAGLIYNIETQNWICDFCKKEFTLEQLMKHHNKRKKIESNSMHGYFCDNCGADIVSCDDNISSICLYCESPVIIKERFEGEYKPELISPFKHTKEEIIKEFLKLSEDRGLVPKSFFDSKNIVSVNGVYIPLFIVTCEVSASVRGDAFISKHFRCSFERKGTMRLEEVPADAQSSIDDNYIRALEPFEFEKLEKFEYPYLAGMSAEAYDQTKEQVYEQQMIERIENAAYERVLKLGKKYYSYDIISKEAKTFCSEFKHALIPIWCIHVKHKGKTYIYYVNDQNLKVVGTFPIDSKKEVLFFLFSILNNLLVIGGSMLFDKPISYLIAIAGTFLVWYIYSNVITSYVVLNNGKKNKDYIDECSVLPISLTDSDYRVR